MRHQAAGAIEHESIARLTDMDRRDHVPNQLQIDHRNGNAVAGARAGDRNGHVRLGTFVQGQRAVPDTARARTEHRGVIGTINAAVHHVRI